MTRSMYAFCQGDRGRTDKLGDSRRLDLLAKVLAIRGIAITQQIAWSSVPRERFGYLSRRPACGRVPCDIKAHDLPAIVRQNDHNIEQPKRSGHHDEQVDRNDAGGLIAEKATPGW